MIQILVNKKADGKSSSSKMKMKTWWDRGLQYRTILKRPRSAFCNYDKIILWFVSRFYQYKKSYNSLGHVNLADGYTVCISTKARMLFCCSTWHGVPMPSCPKGWSTAAATSTQPHWHRPLQILNGSRGDHWSLKISKLLPGRTAHQAPGLKDHARRLQPHHCSGSRWSGHAGRSGKHGCGTHSKEPGTDHIPDLAAADNFAAAIGGYGMDEPLLIWSKRARYCKKVIF